MRKTIILVLLTAVLVTGNLVSGCSKIGQAREISEQKELTGFTSVSVQDMFQVDIVQSNSFSVSVSADRKFFDYVSVSQEGDALTIRLKPNHPFAELLGKTFKAQVAMPVLRELKLSGASRGTVSGFESLENVSILVSGASTLNITNIEAAKMELELSGASRVKGTIKTGEADFEISGASRLELTVSADSLSLEASGASRLYLLGFPVKVADVNLSGASEATLAVKDQLEPVLSDASKLYFEGNPVTNGIKVSGASSIKQK